MNNRIPHFDYYPLQSILNYPSKWHALQSISRCSFTRIWWRSQAPRWRPNLLRKNWAIHFSTSLKPQVNTGNYIDIHNLYVCWNHMVTAFLILGSSFIIKLSYCHEQNGNSSCWIFCDRLLLLKDEKFILVYADILLYINEETINGWLVSEKKTSKINLMCEYIYMRLKLLKFGIKYKFLYKELGFQ